MPQYLSFPGRYKSYAKHCSHAGDHVQHTRTFKYTVYTPIKSACSFVLIRGSLPYQLVYLDCHQDFSLSVLNASSSSIILCYTDQGDHAAVSERKSDTELGLVCPSRSKHKALPSRVPPRTFLTCQGEPQRLPHRRDSADAEANKPQPAHLSEPLWHLLSLPEVLAEVAVIFAIGAVVVRVAESALLGVKGQAVGKCFSLLLGQRSLVFFHTFLRLKCYIFLQKRRE